MNIDGSDVRQVSNGEGRTTCSYWFKGGKKVLYASTHGGSRECPPNPDFAKYGYVWAVYNDYDIYTSTPDGKDIKKLTNSPGYDGGAFYSPDSKWIVYRGSHPTDPKLIQRDKDLLKQGLIVPLVFEVWVMKADGSGKRQVTHLNAASFAPYFTPDGKHIIFCTNYFATDPKKRNFDLAVINIDGTGLERITYNESFDGFPMFSPDGKKLVFASNRNDATPGDTNIFIADWVK
jgi:Tol biopolymer transport system component